MTQQEFARLGGLARARTMTRAARVASARKAIRARWRKYRAAQKAAEKTK